ncbi:hypothetical protein PAHAL_5G132900 [Panicum hallii]|jgi:hypothetical protein|uniref:Uncharacterized protein n=1 Tax=Panicum hallii TaxID=206008 RepID=A0A2T8IJV4_9POAL|nr:hypothetical protein PAHAL_5G132900 [Panicum hallii]
MGINHPNGKERKGQYLPFCQLHEPGTGAPRHAGATCQPDTATAGGHDKQVKEEKGAGATDRVPTVPAPHRTAPASFCWARSASRWAGNRSHASSPPGSRGAYKLAAHALRHPRVFFNPPPLPSSSSAHKDTHPARARGREESLSPFAFLPSARGSPTARPEPPGRRSL